MILGSPAALRCQSQMHSKAAPRALFFLLFGVIFKAPAPAISSPPQELLRKASISYLHGGGKNVLGCERRSRSVERGAGGEDSCRVAQEFSCALCFLTLT